jgi:predicted RNase H-like HicB family nuclease
VTTGGKTMTKTLTVTIWREDEGYVSLCPELDIASQGDTVEEARANLQEAVDLFFETADASEVAERLKPEMYVTSLEVNIGEAA